MQIYEKKFIQTIDKLGLLKNLLQCRINYTSKKFYNTTLTEIDAENVFEAEDDRYF